MRKLRIRLDELQVESFATDGPCAEQGTVAAHAKDTDPSVCQYTEDWRCSEGYGCTLPDYTCSITCGGPVNCAESEGGACA